ncbi:hypothetical protein PYCCODRAFT_676339 [Trametes coccinea BRFM310]|uniref:Uncharacterized protein n=1 Tax=Trametes coccinea (strain BRFM310) TaxID=1353009 RepID=A0A1Y2IHT2_TRAC3|nr:hypothetical protein PYCCODRAFT_676339 [Trametes coccinea BRFM310]
MHAASAAEAIHSGKTLLATFLLACTWCTTSTMWALPRRVTGFPRMRRRHWVVRAYYDDDHRTHRRGCAPAGGSRAHKITQLTVHSLCPWRCLSVQVCLTGRLVPVEDDEGAFNATGTGAIGLCMVSNHRLWLTHDGMNGADDPVCAATERRSNRAVEEHALDVHSKDGAEASLCAIVVRAYRGMAEAVCDCSDTKFARVTGAP